MPTYVMTYHGEMKPTPNDPAEVKAAVERWVAWYDSMGDDVVDVGAPLGVSSSISPDGSTNASFTSITGYTIVNANDMTAAQTMAKDCPVLRNGLTVQINQVIARS